MLFVDHQLTLVQSKMGAVRTTCQTQAEEGIPEALRRYGQLPIIWALAGGVLSDWCFWILAVLMGKEGAVISFYVLLMKWRKLFQHRPLFVVHYVSPRIVSLLCSNIVKWTPLMSNDGNGINIHHNNIQQNSLNICYPVLLQMETWRYSRNATMSAIWRTTEHFSRWMADVWAILLHPLLHQGLFWRDFVIFGKPVVWILPIKVLSVNCLVQYIAEI